MTDGIKYVFLAGGLFIATSGSGLPAAPLDHLRQLVVVDQVEAGAEHLARALLPGEPVELTLPAGDGETRNIGQPRRLDAEDVEIRRH